MVTSYMATTAKELSKNGIHTREQETPVELVLFFSCYSVVDKNGRQKAILGCPRGKMPVTLPLLFCTKCSEMHAWWLKPGTQTKVLTFFFKTPTLGQCL